MIDNSIEFEYAIAKKDLGFVTFFDSTMLSLEPNRFDDKFYNSYGLVQDIIRLLDHLELIWVFLLMKVDLYFT